MKYLYRLFLISCLAVFISSCEKSLPAYSYQQCMLNFDYADTLQTYSFIYSNGAQSDTVWYDVTTLGFVSDVDRPFELQQVATGDNDAVAGTHYVSFDDESLKKFYFIPAKAVKARIPIVVKRDASLTTQDYTLKFTFKTNDNFTTGYEPVSTVKLVISNKLSKPTAWVAMCNYYFGKYGPVKHQFMIDATGFRWDDNYLKNVLHVLDFAQSDQTYIAYLAQLIQKKLTEYNAQRASQGLGKLTEADGTIVTFPF